MKQTRYFTEQVLRKRPYMRPEWIEKVLARPVKVERQADGRLRYWGWMPQLGRYLRVVTLADGETAHKRRGPDMRLHYYPDTDSLYIDLAERPGVDSREVAPGVVLDFDAAGVLVGIDIDHASRQLDLSRVETHALPAKSAPR